MPAILVVEDDEANLELLTRFLRRAGHRVFHAVDGVKGVRAAQEHNPDVIVMDLGLPGLDGWDAARQIRSNQETAHIPMVALSAHTLAGDVQKARKAGFDAYETKPVNYTRLMSKLEAFFNR